jgi:hypothetical protein
MKHGPVSICLVLASTLLLLPRASALPTVTTAYSANWSGYVATAPFPFTSVSASWTVPNVSATSPPAYSTVWVGIGGWYSGSNRLLQAGTEQDVLSNGSTVYYVWHEVYPRPSVLVALISAGDSIRVAISEVIENASMWRMLIVRNSETILNLTVRMNANRASEATAEFIVERPTIQVGRHYQLTTLANFGTVTFSGCDTNQGTLASLTSAYLLIMTSNGTSSGTYLAEPGTLDVVTNGFSILYSTTAVDELSTSPLVLVVALISSLLGTSLISRKRDGRR